MSSAAVAGIIATHLPVPIERVGVKDTFGESGTGAELMDKYGLRSTNIVAAVRQVLARKEHHDIGKREVLEVTPAVIKATTVARITKAPVKVRSTIKRKVQKPRKVKR